MAGSVTKVSREPLVVSHAQHDGHGFVDKPMSQKHGQSVEPGANSQRPVPEVNLQNINLCAEPLR